VDFAAFWLSNKSQYLEILINYTTNIFIYGHTIPPSKDGAQGDAFEV
jgi:hypothetical protein